LALAGSLALAVTVFTASRGFPGGTIVTAAVLGCGGLLLAAIAHVVARLPREAFDGYATLATLLAVLGFVVFGVAPHLFGYRPVVVLSGSMVPTFRPGDTILVRPKPAADVRVGDIITYEIPVGDHHVESHRVVKILSGGASPTVITQGDANSSPDPWRARLTGRTIWTTFQVVPKVGYGILVLRSKYLLPFLVFVIPTLLAGIGIARIWGLSLRLPSAAR
jgi:signal peptidase